MPHKGGIKEAAKLLSGLDHENRLKVLEIIARQDPQMAEMLRKNLIVLEDLFYLTPKMILELVKEVSPQDMGLALRISNPKLRDYVLAQLPKMMRAELEEVLLGPPQALSKVQEGTDRIIETIRRKIERGEIIIKKEGDEYV